MDQPTVTRSMTLRLPPDIGQALDQLADVNRRSLNSQALIALEGWLFANGPDWFRRHVAERNNAMQRGTLPQTRPQDSDDAA